MNLACELPSHLVDDVAAYLQVVARCGLHGISLCGQLESASWDLLSGSLSSCSSEPPPRLAVLNIGHYWQRHGGTWLDRAAVCDAKHLVIDAGLPGDDQRAAHFAAIRRLADESAERGITVCLDTLPGLCENSRAMAKTLQEIEHASVRLCFDLGGYLRLNPQANAEIALQRLLGWVGLVRLRDFGVGSRSACYPPLGSGGAVDFVLVLQVLRTSGFAGPCIISFDRDQRPPHGIEAFTRDVSASVKHLRDCGWFD